MNIITWNINGIRALYKKDLFQQVFSGSGLGITKNPDIICFQETKAEREQLPQEILEHAGYYAYFSSSKIRKGYSGVALYSKTKPLSVVYGMKNHENDDEGRLITAEYETCYIITGYYPNGGQGPHRLEYKLRFYDDFLKYIKKLQMKKPVIFCGDINTAHTEIDLARPRENVMNTGFLPIERAWIDQVIKAGFIDVFRTLHPDVRDMYTYWDQKTAARTRNVGWRIDYFFASQELLPKIKKCEILSNIIGSDHCPIWLQINVK